MMQQSIKGIAVRDKFKRVALVRDVAMWLCPTPKIWHLGNKNIENINEIG